MSGNIGAKLKFWGPSWRYWGQLEVELKDVGDSFEMWKLS